VGRKPWSNRLTVEECYTLSIQTLARDKVFSSPIGTIWSTIWTNCQAEELLRLGYTVSRTAAGRLALYFCYDAADGYSLTARRIEFPVEITTTYCYLGGKRHWFLCPFFRNGVRCRRRVGRLYLPPGEPVLGCRLCYGLTYKTCQTHNKRLDRLIKNPSLLKEALRSQEPSEAILGVAAWTRLVGRLGRRT